MTSSQTPSQNAKRVLFICGSLRKRSLNRQLGERAQAFIGEAAFTSWLAYEDLPYMNQDWEFPVPDAVQRVREEVTSANALWICSPEYNHGIPGVLKNCIDWLSRPVAPDSKETVLQHKLITYSCCGGSAQARYAGADLGETLGFVSDQVIHELHLQKGLKRQDYVTDVLELSPAELEALKAQVALLLDRLLEEPASA